MQEQAQLEQPFNISELLVYKARFKEYGFNKHSHEEFSLGVVSQGVQSFMHKGAKHIITPNDTLISVNPDEIHTGESELKEGYTYKVLFIDPSYIFHVLGAMHDKESLQAYIKSATTYDPNFALELRNLLHRQEHKQLSKLAFEEGVINFIERFFQKHARMPLLSQNNHDSARITLAKEYICDNFEQSPNLDEISKSIGLSKFHFFRLFKEHLGLTPHEFLMIQKIKRVKQAIKAGESLSVAAQLGGFADQAHMSRHFKKLVSLTPGVYQKAFKSA